MAHVPALPGSPLYDAAAGMQGASTTCAATSRYWSRRASTACSSATRTTARTCSRRRPCTSRRWPRITGELAPVECPFGVDYLWDARAALGDRGRLGAAFIARSCPACTRATWASGGPTPARCCGTAGPTPRTASCVLMNVTPEFASPLGTRPGGRASALGGRLDAGRRDPRLGRHGGRRAGRRDRAGGPGRARRERAGDPQHGRAGEQHRDLRPAHRRRHRRQRPQASTADTWNPVERERVRRFLDAARSA